MHATCFSQLHCLQTELLLRGISLPKCTLKSLVEVPLLLTPSLEVLGTIYHLRPAMLLPDLHVQTGISCWLCLYAVHSCAAVNRSPFENCDSQGCNC